MNFNIEVRKKQLHSLNQYINSTKDKVESILNYLGWTGKTILETSDKIQCPIDKKHRIPIENIEKHVEKCSLKSVGYDTKDNFLSESQSSCTISLDPSKKIEILNAARQVNPKFKPAWNGMDLDPMTSDRYISTYSVDERLALYDYCIQNTEGPPVPNELTMNVDESNIKEEIPLSAEERLIRQRDAKRRSVKYKSVHTGRNKSHTEVMREVIQNQMDMYKDYITEKQKIEEEAERKRQQELLEKAQAYEQFPHIDTRVVYDYGIDPFEITENSYLENSCNSIISYNVSYDYETDLPPKIEQDVESVTNVNNYKDKDEKIKHEKKDDYKYKPHSKPYYIREKERRQRSREKDYKKRSDRRSRERREYYSRRSREDRRESYLRSERRH